MHKLKTLILLSVFSGLLISCASKPKVIFKRNDLCGLIIDEKNQPISDFVFTFQKNGKSSVYITNQKGMFFVPNVKTGKFKIKGEKKGYSRVEEQELYFSEEMKVYCWQVKSLDGALDSVERLVKTEQFEKCLEILASVEMDKKSECYSLSKKMAKKIKLRMKEVKKYEKEFDADM